MAMQDQKYWSAYRASVVPLAGDAVASGGPFAGAKKGCRFEQKVPYRYFSDHTRGPFAELLAQNGGEGWTYLWWP